MFRMSVLKSMKSWVRSPKRRLMRGCEKHRSVKKVRHAWGSGESLSTHLGGTRSHCGDKRKAIEDELRASGESKEDNVKTTNEYADETGTDRKRVKNETGLGSPSTGAVTRRSGVGDFSGEVEEVESKGFGSSSEEKAFSLLASVNDMVDATRRDGRRLGNEDGTVWVKHPVFLSQGHCDRPPAKTFPCVHT
jgi:hypothetical protein